MDTANVLILLLAGAVTGFLAGFFGVGGGIILVPILLYFFVHTIGISTVVATHLTFGTSLLVVIFASLMSASQYTKNNHVVWKAVLYIGTASTIGAAAGSTIAAGLHGRALQQIFALVVTIAALRLMSESPRAHGDGETNLSPVGLSIIGVVVGLVSSLAGVGGGVFSIPMMYYFMRFPLKKALGTSSASIVITAFASMVGYVVNGWNDILVSRYAGMLGYVDYLHAIPIIIGTLPMAKWGATIAHKTDVDKLRKYYAVFLLAIAMKMFFF